MPFISKVIIIFFIFYYPKSYALVKTKLKELSTKQNIFNLRLFTDDGKYTYYQTFDGKLMLSLNYKVINLHKSKKSDQYYLLLGKDKQNLTIELVEHFHRSSNIQKNNQIFYSKLGDKKITFIDNGVVPKLHLKDQFISYYDSKNKLIKIQKLSKKGLSWTILIGTKINPYFVPDINMIDQQNILFTTLDKKGKTLIIHYNLETKKHSSIFITESSKFTVQSCATKEHFFFGAFSTLGYKNSIIYKIEKDLTFHSIYDSKSDDIGNLICGDDQLVFLKRTYLNKKITDDAYSIDLNMKNKLTKISDLSFLTQLVKIGSTIIAPFHGNFFVISGLDDLTKFDKINK